MSSGDLRLVPFIPKLFSLVFAMFRIRVTWPFTGFRLRVNSYRSRDLF